MSETSIVCEQDGPYCVSGSFVVKDAQGNAVVPGDTFGGRYVSNLVTLEVLDADTSP